MLIYLYVLLLYGRAMQCLRCWFTYCGTFKEAVLSQNAEVVLSIKLLSSKQLLVVCCLSYQLEAITDCLYTSKGLLSPCTKYNSIELSSFVPFLYIRRYKWTHGSRLSHILLSGSYLNLAFCGSCLKSIELDISKSRN